MKKLLALICLAAVLYSCTQTQASSVIKPSPKPPEVTYTIISNTQTYPGVKEYKLDTVLHSIKFHYTQEGCGCGEKTEKDVELYGSYNIEKEVKK